jgi:plasmid stabilization system protein ParE
VITSRKTIHAGQSPSSPNCAASAPGSPKACRSRPELGEDIRSFAYGNYVILNQDSQNDLCIVRVLHGAMDIENRFSEK